MKKSFFALLAGFQLVAIAFAQESVISGVTGGQQYIAVAAQETVVIAPEFQPPSVALLSISSVSNFEFGCHTINSVVHIAKSI